MIPVRFYEALPNAPTLGLVNVIYPGINDPQFYPDWTIGTPTTPYVAFTGARSPLGLRFDHICGTVDEFSNGANYDPAIPPIPIGAQLLPLCCAPPPRVGGGAGAGGRGVYTIIPPHEITSVSVTPFNNFTVSAGQVIACGGGGFVAQLVILGPYTGATVGGWNFLGSVVLPGGSMTVSRYWKITNTITEPFPFDTTAGGVFCVVLMRCDGSSALDAGVSHTGHATTDTPATVNTSTRVTAVTSWWAFPSAGVFFFPPGFAMSANAQITATTPNFRLFGIINTTTSGTPYTPGAATWTVATDFASASDSFT